GLPPATASAFNDIAALVLPMPTTNVGMPAVSASATACCVPVVSSMFRLLAAVVAQLGCPSVASRMNFGFGSVRPVRYETAPWIHRRVGVPVAPLNTLAVSAPVTAVAFTVVIGTMGAVATPHCAVSLPR